MRLGRVPELGSAEWQDASAQVKEMDLLKQVALYVWVGDGGPSTTSEHIAEDDKAHSSIKAGKAFPRAECRSDAVDIFRYVDTMFAKLGSRSAFPSALRQEVTTDVRTFRTPEPP